MQNFQGTFEAPKRSFISAFSICMTVPFIGKKRLTKIFKHRNNDFRLTCDSITITLR